MSQPTSPVAGVKNHSAEEILRRHMSPSIAGHDTDAILAALAAGDAGNIDLAQKAFKQLFASSASGSYLDIQAANRGLSRPAGVGISDRDFRKYIAAYTNGKVTLESILEILEILYGSSSTRAFSQSSSFEPFDLDDQDTLKILLDEKFDTEITFATSDFQNISAATAIEIAAKITRKLHEQGISGYAVDYLDPDTGNKFVRIFSGSLGVRGSVAIHGGKAQDVFLFPNKINTTQVAGTTFVISAGSIAGRLKYSWTVGTDPSLYLVRVDDYVNIRGGTFNALNRGTFKILKVTGTYFEVENLVGVNQSVAIGSASELAFYRPRKSTVYDSQRPAFAVQAHENTLLVRLPVTTQIVQRSPSTGGSYLPAAVKLAITSATRDEDGIMTVDSATAHGLATGNNVLLDGLVADLATGTNSRFFTAGPDLAVPRSYHGLVKLQNGKVLAVGGFTAIGASGATTNCELWDPVTNTWGAAGSLNTARGHHQTFLLPNGKVITIGGVNAVGTPLATTETYDPVTDLWTATASMSVARERHAAVMMPSNKIMVVGGGNTGIETYNYLSNSWVVSTATAADTSRYGIAATALPDGRVVFGGGYDVLAVNDYELTCYQYNSNNDSILLRSGLPWQVAFHKFIWIPKKYANGTVITFGGLDSAGAKRTRVATMDTASSVWTETGAMSDTRQDVMADMMPDGLVLVTGEGAPNAQLYHWSDGTIATSNTMVDQHLGGRTVILDDGRVFMVGGEETATVLDSTSFYTHTSVASSGRLNGVFPVLSAPSPTQFTVQTQEHGVTDTVVDDATLTTFKALPGTTGPYIYDPLHGLAVTKFETTLMQQIDAGVGYDVIHVTDATIFPDEEGFVVFDFGYENQTGPVRYVHAPDLDHIVLDKNFVFTKTIENGAKVCLLKQNSPYVPVRPQDLGGLYATASTAGLVAARDAMDQLTAAGIDLTKEILYPGDVGLGNAGYPTHGAQELSDAVWIWGGDDLEEELEEARNS